MKITIIIINAILGTLVSSLRAHHRNFTISHGFLHGRDRALQLVHARIEHLDLERGTSVSQPPPTHSNSFVKWITIKEQLESVIYYT